MVNEVAGLLDDGIDENWTFQMGEMVTHKDQPLPSMVLLRVRTSRGAEVYGVRSFMIDDEGVRDRMIFADSLVAMANDHPAWDVCLLTGTGMDPRVMS